MRNFLFSFLISVICVSANLNASTAGAAGGHGDSERDAARLMDHLLARMRATVALPPEQLAYVAAMGKETEGEYAKQKKAAKGFNFEEKLGCILPTEILLTAPNFRAPGGITCARGSNWYFDSLTGVTGASLPQPMTLATCAILDAAQLLNMCGSFGDPNELLKSPQGWVHDCRQALRAANLYAKVPMSQGIDWFFHGVARGEFQLECGMFAKSLRMLALRTRMGRRAFELDSTFRDGSLVTLAGCPSVFYRNWTTLRSLTGDVDPTCVITYETLMGNSKNPDTREDLSRLSAGDVISISGVSAYSTRHPHSPMGMINAVCLGSDMFGENRFMTFTPGKSITLHTLREFQEMLLGAFIQEPSAYERDLIVAQPWRAKAAIEAETAAAKLSAEYEETATDEDARAMLLDRLCPVACLYTVKEDLFDPRDPLGSVQARARALMDTYEASVRGSAGGEAAGDTAEALDFIAKRRAYIASFG